MKKIFLNEAEKQKIIAEREKAIMESFAKTYNQIKRVDENEITDLPMYEANYDSLLSKSIMAGVKSSVKEIDGEDWELEDRKQQYGINPEIDQLDMDYSDGVDENEMLDEGLKQWIAGGLIALTTLGGVGKIYQLNQEKAANHQIEMKYYNDVLSNTLDKMSKEDLASLGININDKTNDLALGREYSNDELNSIFSNYAGKYIQSHPKEFGVNQNGGIQWLGSK
jgi:hypothetical protein